MLLRAFIFLAIVVFGLLAPATIYSYASSDSCGLIFIPAIDERSGRGVAIETEICLVPGEGDIYLAGVGRVGNDTVVSLLVAFVMSQLISGVPLKDRDIVIRFINKDIRTVEGPSAGALITFALTNLASEGYIPQRFSGTGGINVDGSVENVGGIANKIEALIDKGVRKIFIPASFYVTSRQELDSIVSKYRSSLGEDIDIIPVTSIDQLFNRSINILELTINPIPSEAVNRYAREVFNSYERRALEKLRELNKTIVELLDIPEYMGLRQQYEASQILYRLYLEVPREYRYSYTRVNLLYLSTYLLGNIYNQMRYAEMDLEELKRTLDSVIEEINSSLPRYIEPIRALPNELTIENYGLYILYIERIFDLINIRDNLIALRSNIDEATLLQISNQVSRAEARMGSLDFWMELIDLSLRNIPAVDSSINRDNIERITSFLGIRSGEIEQQAKRLFSEIYGEGFNISILEPGIMDLLKLYTVYQNLESYSLALKFSTIDTIYRYSLVTNSTEPFEKFIHELEYMKVNYILDSMNIGRSLLGQIYIFAALSLDLLSKSRYLLGSDSIFVSSIVSTSATASALALTLFTIIENIDTPGGLDVSLEDRGFRLRETIDIFADIYSSILNMVLTISLGINIVALALIARARTSYKI